MVHCLRRANEAAKNSHEHNGLIDATAFEVRAAAHHLALHK
jgi:hypothetical protein